ncbi:hypothetical protein BWQ96_03698 [Gracilariopsis chorda]|uniref:Uncharacterized protein n=1 Tax=Gracilariopsis chorda TaxID=448386 RepID=A0A2V3IZN4_9FLOR|nr:hypothetical protein BWQ96_03698 [Gracilariopsis chorda]|eukprot:PXF46570.1 hypothetical protein BWQ96_03698 [Gracilariopsis chorda]
MAKHMQHADLTAQLLSDISPDQAIRWITLQGLQKKLANQRIVPHVITRSLFSILLRAASDAEAQLAQDAIKAVLLLPQEHDASALGFSAGDCTSFITNVLVEMLSASAQDEPLLSTAFVLSFYSEAGAGAGDADEFHIATPEHRVAHCFPHESLSDVRQRNLAKTIRTFAEAFQEQGCKRKLLEVARSNMHRLLTPWLSILPTTIGQLEEELREALLCFYNALLQALREDERDELVTRLVGSIMQTVQSNVDHLHLYLDCIADESVRFSACRLCLIQRFRVNDNHSKPLTIRKLIDGYFTLKPVTGRANQAVPALLTCLICAWLEIVLRNGSEVGVLWSGKPEGQPQSKRLKTIHSSKNRVITRFADAPSQDIIAFKMAISKLLHHMVTPGL